MLQITETYNKNGEPITDDYKIVCPELQELLTEVCQKIEGALNAVP